MERKEELKVCLVSLDRQLSALQEKRNACAQELSILSCPYKVGDRLKRQVERGWRPNKKIVTEIWEIIRISPGSFGAEFRVVGRLVLKNGELGQREGSLDFSKWGHAPKWELVKS